MKKLSIKNAIGQSYSRSRRSTKSLSNLKELNEEDDEDEGVFVKNCPQKEYLRYGDCPQFRASKDESIFCNGCNETKDSHILSQSYARDMCPTNAYGSVEFVGANRTTRAKYIRLSDKTSNEKLKSLFLNDWNLGRWPELLISVVGGGNSTFALRKHLDANLRQGFRKVALSVNPWFLTGGTDNGAIKFIGSVLEGHTYKDVKIIGVLPWGVVAGREVLVSDRDTFEGYTPKYPPIKKRGVTSIKRLEFYLNRNHSHFILVDTGKVGITDGELEFRSELERMLITEQIKQCRKSMAYKTRRNSDQFNKKFISAVQIVINGGPRVIETIANTLQVEEKDCVIMPVIVIADSGRAADLIALAYKLTEDDKNFNELGASYEYVLMNKIESLYPRQSEEENLKTLRFLMKCMKKKKHITIYDAQNEQADLDEIILSALMRMDEEDDEEFSPTSAGSALDLYTVAQLNLTLLWNRADIAQKKIFNKYTLKQHEPLLEDLMLSALLENKRSFVEMLLENGFDLKSFSYEKIAKLYSENYKPCKSLLRAFVNTNKEPFIVLSEYADKCLYQQVDCFTSSLPVHMPEKNSDCDEISMNTLNRQQKCDNDPINYLNLCCIQKAFIRLSGIDLTPYYRSKGITAEEKLNAPLNELFLWAVLCNKQELALNLWNHGNELLAKALIAHRLYLQMAYHYRSNHIHIEEEVLEQLKANAREFGQLALELLDQCSSKDKQATKQLLSQELKNWGNHTCMTLAESSEFEEFISHPSCQDLVLEKWRGSLVFYGRRASYKVVLGLLFLPIIFFYEFKDIRNYSEDEKSQRSILKNIAGSFQMVFHKIHLFSTAPITKFWASFFAFLIFLFVFGYILLIPFPTRPCIIEWCLIGFVLNFTLEEIRQILKSRGNLFRQKLHAWWTTGWNKMDLFAILLFYIGFSLRVQNSGQARCIGRIVYALDLSVWILRLLDVFSVNRKLGPYVVTIKRMLYDVFYFIIILSVFLLSYGIARYAILSPNEKFTTYSFYQMLLIPYFQIFGEMFLEFPHDTNKTKTVFETPYHDKFSESVVLVIMAIYLILTNVLLVNLLIAVFNNTYSRVQLNCKRVWKWQWYCLVEEYSTRPALVPPFNLVNYVIDFAYFLRYLLCDRILSPMKEFKPQRRYSIRHTDAAFSLMKFEEECQSNYLALKKASLHDTDRKFEEIKTRGNDMQDMLAATSMRLAILDKKIGKMNKTMENHVQRLYRVEKLLQRSSTSNILDLPRGIGKSRTALLSDSRLASPRSPKMFSMKPLHLEDLSSSLNSSSSWKLKRDDSIGGQKHVLSRSLCYPYSNIHRFTFDDNYVEWKVPFENYKPVHYTSLAVQLNLSWADNESNSQTKVKYNEIDGNINRMSFLGIYDIVNGLPRNPMGRTGLYGRGCLGRYGPNHIVEPIITRYQKRRDGSIYSDCYEVLVIAKDSGDFELPSGSVNVDVKIPHILDRLFSHNTLREIGLTEEKHRLPALENMKRVFNDPKNCSRIYQGYLDDERNTDNAWVETSVVNYHDDEGALNKFFICERLVKLLKLHWVELNENAQLPDHQLFYLKNVAAYRNAVFENL